MERKPKFRSRKIDLYKPLPVFRFNELPEMEELSSVSRAMPAIPTGVDKEEEEEHHLQAAIAASQLQARPVYIPTPTALKKMDNADDYYKGGYKQPKSLIRFSALIEECVSIPYDMDDEDQKWLSAWNEKQGSDNEVTEDQFEMVINQLETVAKEKGLANVTVEDLNPLSNVPVVASVVNNHGKKLLGYWNAKRMKQDDGAKSASDPYVCFRRREIKTQRKTRRSDVHSLEKLRKLRGDLEAARSLLELVCKRDKFKRESLLLDCLIFEQTVIVEDLKKKCDPTELASIAHLRPVLEKKPKPFKKLKYLEHEQSALTRRRETRKEITTPRSSTVRARLTEPTSPALKSIDSTLSMTQNLLSYIDKELNKKRRVEEDYSDVTDWPVIPSQPLLSDIFYANEQSSNIRIRTRIGRGGRIIYDRQIRGVNFGTYGHESEEQIEYPITEKFQDQYVNLLSSEDLSKLQNSAITNYNQHYLSVTSGIARPSIDYSTLITNTPANPRVSHPKSTPKPSYPYKTPLTPKKKTNTPRPVTSEHTIPLSVAVNMPN